MSTLSPIICAELATLSYQIKEISGLSGSRKAQAENEAKLINAAWDTIKKKLK